MGRLLSIFGQLPVLFIFSCYLNCLAASSLTVEERLQAIEATNVRLLDYFIYFLLFFYIMDININKLSPL